MANETSTLLAVEVRCFWCRYGGSAGFPELVSPNSLRGIATREGYNIPFGAVLSCYLMTNFRGRQP